jgi:hypothetical protein
MARVALGLSPVALPFANHCSTTTPLHLHLIGQSSVVSVTQYLLVFVCVCACVCPSCEIDGCSQRHEMQKSVQQKACTQLRHRINILQTRKLAFQYVISPNHHALLVLNHVFARFWHVVTRNCDELEFVFGNIGGDLRK